MITIETTGYVHSVSKKASNGDVKLGLILRDGQGGGIFASKWIAGENVPNLKETVGVRGTLVSNKWKDKDGGIHHSLEVRNDGSETENIRFV